jgi:type VI secretion system protein ImpG
MQYSQQLFKRYLEELQSLEAFRLQALTLNPRVPLNREDPDVQRLVESLAFFNASSKDSVRHSQLLTTRRIFQQFFSYLLDPLPGMAMLSARQTGQFVETAFLPRGSQVVISTPDKMEALFHTLWSMRLLPFSLTALEFIPRIGRGNRLIMRFRAPYSRNDDIETVSLYINQFNDFYTSLRIQQAIQNHVTGCFVAFGENVTSQTEGSPCELSFGAPNVDDLEAEDRFSHPIERVRTFFHFPEKELFLNIQIPSTPHLWSTFAIIIDLDELWPKSVSFNEETFQLGVVPIVNLRQAMAEPFLCDGKSDRYPIIYPEPGDNFELHSLNAVYEVTTHGYQPLQSGVLSRGCNSFELEYAENQESGVWLLVKSPESFANPKQLAIDGMWHQPWFSKRTSEHLEVHLYDRHLSGLVWELNGKIAPTRENKVRHDVDALLEILALRMKTQLKLDELQLIVACLGALEYSPFRDIPRLVDELAVEKLPHSHEQMSGFMLRYRFRLRQIDESLMPLIKMFFTQLQLLIDSWVFDTVVELRVETSDGECKIDFK